MQILLRQVVGRDQQQRARETNNDQIKTIKQKHTNNFNTATLLPMTISIIAALTKNRVIGKHNGLPWSLPDDSKYFMQTTKGHYVLLGRKNYDSLPEKYRPLPNRTNVIITRQKSFSAPGCIIVDSLDNALQIARDANEAEAFIIGGAEIYALGLPFADRLYLTEIDGIVDGDTYFPEFNKADWKEISRKHHPKDEKHEFGFDFVVYERVVLMCWGVDA